MRRIEQLHQISLQIFRRDNDGIEYQSQLYREDFGEILPRDLVIIMNEVRRLEQVWENK